MSYQIIQSSSQLDSVCQFLRQPTTTLMLDTEFVRTRTYYAKLGLLQLFDGNECFLVDPVLLSLKNSEFWSLLQRHHWVLHAFGEDLEILNHHVDTFGLSVFDTQIGAAFLGHGVSLGYQALIEQTTGILLDKGESRTDWLARPLTEKQLDYASKDVIYLKTAYEAVISQLESRQLYQYALDECTRLAQSRCKDVLPERAYLDVKNAWRLNRQQLAILQLLSAWRVNTAIEKDMPVNNVVKADVLWNIAKYQPTQKTALKNTGITPQALRIHGCKLLELVKQGSDLDESSWPLKIKRMIDYPNYKSSLKLVRESLAIAEAETTIPAEVLAPKRLIHEWLSWLWQDNKEHESHMNKPVLLSGWRAEVLPHYLPAC
ncbi:MAG: Ribonuclease D [Candidatus Celerinatantimonas neptuna]|nr:MAG: Ribonuclease D [Candidatus Celerinatantimonas neptuna]